jgi:outer membrane protein (TIGR04327 family)
MKKTILLFILFFTKSIFGDENLNENTYSEFGIKYQSIIYNPYEFRPINDIITNSKSKLKHSKDIIYPGFAKYRNYSKNYGIDFDYVSFDISNASYRDSNLPNGFKRIINYVRRDEFNLNFYYIPFENSPDLFLIGLGIKKIDRVNDNQDDGFSVSISNDKINAYGVSIPVRSKVNLLDNLYLNLSIDPYIAAGKRKFKAEYAFSSRGLSGSYNNFLYTYTNPNSITEILGFQADLSFSYKLLNKWNFYIGGSINNSRFRFINSQERRFRYDGSEDRLIIFDDRINNLESKKNSNFDKFTSIYFGISVIY